MADNSHIEWTDATWNPITGCSIVSPGCINCYAMKLAGTRLRNIPSRAGLTMMTKAGPVWNGEVRLNEEWLHQPFGWKRRRRIFVCAHGDLFAEKVPLEWIDRVFAVMAMNPRHTFQVLTKRPDRMQFYVSEWFKRLAVGDIPVDHPTGRRNFADLVDWAVLPAVLPNVWLGVSAERQQEANERVPLLIDTPATVRFVSAEPLLGHIAFHALNLHTDSPSDALRGQRCVPDDSPEGYHNEPTAKLDWIIVGGESGPGARPMHPKWAKDIRDWCAAAGVAFFFKQFGAWAPHQFASNGSQKGEICVWPDGRTGGGGANEHGGAGCEMDNVGKKAAGRLLDGVEHNGMPG